MYSLCTSTIWLLKQYLVYIRINNDQDSKLELFNCDLQGGWNYAVIRNYAAATFRNYAADWNYAAVFQKIKSAA